MVVQNFVVVFDKLGVTETDARGNHEQKQEVFARIRLLRPNELGGVKS
jgi:hypothetical protein